MDIKYFALGGEDMASSRLRVYKIAVALNQMGHSVRVTTDEVRGTPSEHLVVVQKRLDLRRPQSPRSPPRAIAVFPVFRPSPKRLEISAVAFAFSADCDARADN